MSERPADHALERRVRDHELAISGTAPARDPRRRSLPVSSGGGKWPGAGPQLPPPCRGAVSHMQTPSRSAERYAVAANCWPPTVPLTTWITGPSAEPRHSHSIVGLDHGRVHHARQHAEAAAIPTCRTVLCERDGRRRCWASRRLRLRLQ
jgi:hypothetical protein